MTKETLREQFKQETGLDPEIYQGKPDADYVEWLENRIIARSEDSCHLGSGRGIGVIKGLGESKLPKRVVIIGNEEPITRGSIEGLTEIMSNNRRRFLHACNLLFIMDDQRRDPPNDRNVKRNVRKSKW